MLGSGVPVAEGNLSRTMQSTSASVSLSHSWVPWLSSLQPRPKSVIGHFILIFTCCWELCCYSLCLWNSFSPGSNVLMICCPGNKGTWLCPSVNSVTSSWPLSQKHFLGIDYIDNYQSKYCKDLRYCLIRYLVITDKKQ